jgi:hypothetical protein
VPAVSVAQALGTGVATGKPRLPNATTTSVSHVSAASDEVLLSAQHAGTRPWSMQRYETPGNPALQRLHRRQEPPEDKAIALQLLRAALMPKSGGCPLRTPRVVIGREPAMSEQFGRSG